jgi:S1-C subfamily serine protease
MNDSSRLESGDRRRFPIWAWFAAINLTVAVAAVAVIIEYLNREQHRINNPAGQPTATLQPKHEQVSPNDIVPSNAPLDGKSDGGNGPETSPLETTMRSATAPLTTADVVAKVQEGVVLLTTYGSGGEKVGYGSGFVIDSMGLVATNFHVLRGASSADVEFHNHVKIKVKGVRAWDMAADLAILELVNVPTKTSVLELSARRRPAYLALFVRLRNFRQSTGECSALNRMMYGYKRMRSSLAAVAADRFWTVRVA